jgi:hypothetical protein
MTVVVLWPLMTGARLFAGPYDACLRGQARCHLQIIRANTTAAHETLAAQQAHDSRNSLLVLFKPSDAAVHVHQVGKARTLISF